MFAKQDKLVRPGNSTNSHSSVPAVFCSLLRRSPSVLFLALSLKYKQETISTTTTTASRRTKITIMTTSGTELVQLHETHTGISVASVDALGVVVVVAEGPCLVGVAPTEDDGLRAVVGGLGEEEVLTEDTGRTVEGYKVS